MINLKSSRGTVRRFRAVPLVCANVLFVLVQLDVDIEMITEETVLNFCSVIRWRARIQFRSSMSLVLWGVFCHIREIKHCFLLMFCILRKLRCTAPRVGNVGHNIVGLLEHPLVAP